MEPNGEPSRGHPAGSQPPAGGLRGKRLKERENAFLQNTLISRADADPADTDAGSRTEPGSSSGDGSAPRPRGTDTETETEREIEAAASVANGRVVDGEEERADARTLTDHLNKRLLSSFLEKLNERDLALPGVQRLDCAVADEDSNRAAEEW